MEDSRDCNFVSSCKITSVKGPAFVHLEFFLSFSSRDIRYLNSSGYINTSCFSIVHADESSIDRDSIKNIAKSI